MIVVSNRLIIGALVTRLALPQYDPANLEFLSDQERAELTDGLESLVGGECPVDFVSRLWPDEPVPAHLLPVVDAIEQARVAPVRVTIDVGPGHAKTTILLRLLIWWLCRSPADQNAYVTYSGAQAMDKSSLALDYASVAGLRLAADSKAKGHWHTPERGGLIAAGARGKLTGQRVPGVILYDDPYKDEQEARSIAINGQVISRFKGVAYTRLQGGSIFVLHTRWGENDLIGWINKNLKWDRIHVPTVADSKDDILGRRIISKTQWLALSVAERARFGPIKDLKDEAYGEVAWSQKYPYAICTEPCGHDGHLDDIRRTIGEALWWALYGGAPRPIGKAIFHEPSRYQKNTVFKENARVFTHTQYAALPAAAQARLTCMQDESRTALEARHYSEVLRKSEFTWTRKRACIPADTAASAKTSADFSAILVVAMSGYGVESEMWIYDCIHVQEEVPEVTTILERIQRKYRLLIAVETVAANAGRAVSQMLRRANNKLRIVDVEVGGKDKFTRSIPLSTAWNQGRVHVPIDEDWADELIEEFKLFTGVDDLHDDIIDAAAHGWNLLYRDRPPVTEADYDQGSEM